MLVLACSRLMTSLLHTSPLRLGMVTRLEFKDCLLMIVSLHFCFNYMVTGNYDMSGISPFRLISIPYISLEIWSWWYAELSLLKAGIVQSWKWIQILGMFSITCLASCTFCLTSACKEWVILHFTQCTWNLSMFTEGQSFNRLLMQLHLSVYLRLAGLPQHRLDNVAEHTWSLHCGYFWSLNEHLAGVTDCMFLTLSGQWR